jgi:hypothetical protein
MGKVTLPCKYADKSVSTCFYVVNSKAPALLSLQTAIDFGLIKLTYAIDGIV